MLAGTGTYVTIIDWTPYKGTRGYEQYRIRKGPDGTIAVWHRRSDIAGDYILTHHCPDGTVLTVGPLSATEARRAMEAERKAAA